jgi:hypothetical protein
MRHPLAALVVFAAWAVPALAIDWSQLPLVGQVSGSAAAVSASTVSAAQQAKSGVVSLLDKQTNRVEEVTLALGKPQKWGALTVTLQRCAWGVGGVPVQDAGWLDITAASGEPEFHGWMFNTFPSVATFDHPRYDARLVRCTRPAGVSAVPVPARVAPPQPAGPDSDTDDEAPAPTAAPIAPGTPEPGDASNPYLVPGVPEDDGTPDAGQPAPLAEPVPDSNPPPAADLPPAPEAPATPPPAEAVPDETQLHQMMEQPPSGDGH